jgi:hypothetical protein
MAKFIFAIVLGIVAFWLMGVLFTAACMRIQFMNSWIYYRITGMFVVTWLQLLSFCGTLFWVGAHK